MTTTTDPFAGARAVADAVLYEGYVLYPYRASSAKNRTRWQFGVLMSPAYAAADPSERSRCRTEVVTEAPDSARLTVEIRFLHVIRRTGGGQPDWDETLEREVCLRCAVSELRAGVRHEFEFDGDERSEAGVHRLCRTVRGAVSVSVTELPGPYGAVRLAVEVANLSRGGGADRDEALSRALIAAHTLLALDAGHFLSMTDPPEWARPLVDSCTNEGTWPVLAGGSQRPAAVVLSSPIILADHPEIAPESPENLYDACEIDEILTLRTMTLTEDEKAQARATDPRAAAVIDHVETLPADQLDRLHGALRYLRQVTGETGDGTGVAPGGPAAQEDLPTYFTPDAPWWDPGADASVDPETDSVLIDGVVVARGSRVRLRPGAAGRRTDAQDLFLAGRTATVECVLFDVDGKRHLGVTPDDDAELAEISRWHGRYLYFDPDEVELVIPS
ncbi:MAG TPA: hypothetical protein VHU88_17750 [Sporichthyaceae bacterium]|jgi:hypothetical protein|nr:hypothetical protein [Sporichthyaceae bacterium]